MTHLVSVHFKHMEGSVFIMLSDHQQQQQQYGNSPWWRRVELTQRWVTRWSFAETKVATNLLYECEHPVLRGHSISCSSRPGKTLFSPLISQMLTQDHTGHICHVTLFELVSFQGLNQVFHSGAQWYGLDPFGARARDWHSHRFLRLGNIFFIVCMERII